MNNQNEDQQKVNFLELLVEEVPYEYKLKNYKMGKKITEEMDYEIDDSFRFRNTVYVYEDKKEEKKINIEKEIFSPEIKREKCTVSSVDVIKWEDHIFDLDDSCDIDKNNRNSGNNTKSTSKSIPNIEMREYVNKLLERDWEEDIMYDKPIPPRPLTLYIDDPNLIFQFVRSEKVINEKIQKIGSTDKPLKNKYNLSNDKFYETEIKTKGSLVSFGIQHSIPALKLNSSFFNINLTKEEMISWHRPNNQLQNKSYSFSNPMQITAKINLIRKEYELSCNDLSDFLVFEYSEEYPFFISKPGMVSVLNKYYRKIDDSDDFTPKDHIIVENDDDCIFMRFGCINKGDQVTALNNNLFTAPVYKHKCQDYLIINTNGKLIFRRINSIFVVGQELPKEEIYAPHSRKLNQFSKDRIKVHCHRIFQRNKYFTFEELNRTFPNFTDGSKRKWIKEYAEMDRLNRENVFIHKNNTAILREDEIRKLVTPENICQYERMIVEEQRMELLGYKIMDLNEEDEKEFIPGWILTRNFINAFNGKGLLEIVGPNEPTGIEEAMSFAKIKFRKVSESDARRLYSEHQGVYKYLIEKVCKKQAMSLSSNKQINKESLDSNDEDGSVQINSNDKIINNTNNLKSSENYLLSEDQALVIKRFFIKNGETVEVIQKVYDKRVINAYLKLKRKIKPDEKKNSIKCSGCGQLGHMKTNKNCPNYQGAIKKRFSEKKPSIKFQERVLKLISTFVCTPFSSPFHRPVNQRKFPSYFQVIKNPIDFFTIKSNCRKGIYKTYDLFLEDLNLLYNNCNRFNGPTHSLTEIARGFLNKANTYKLENFDEIYELEKEIEKGN